MSTDVAAVTEQRWSAFDRALLFAMRTTPLGRGAARRALGAVLRARVGSTPIRVEVNGLTAQLSFDNVPEIKALLRPNGRDAAEAAFLAEVLPASGGLLVDVGANAGIFALAVLALRPSADVLAIEPNPTMAQRAVRNLVALNPQLSGRRTVLQVAAATDEAPLRLDVRGGFGTAAITQCAGRDALSVQGRPLLDVISEANPSRVHAMKVDIEGFEDTALPPFFDNAPEAWLPQRVCLEKPEARYGLAERAMTARGYVEVRWTHGNVLYSLPRRARDA